MWYSHITTTEGNPTVTDTSPVTFSAEADVTFDQLHREFEEFLDLISDNAPGLLMGVNVEMVSVVDTNTLRIRVTAEEVELDEDDPVLDVLLWVPSDLMRDTDALDDYVQSNYGASAKLKNVTVRSLHDTDIHPSRRFDDFVFYGGSAGHSSDVLMAVQAEYDFDDEGN